MLIALLFFFCFFFSDHLLCDIPFFPFVLYIMSCAAEGDTGL